MMQIELHAFYNCRLLDAICFLENILPISINTIDTDNVRDDYRIVVLDNLIEKWRSAQKFGNDFRVILLSKYIEFNIFKTIPNIYAASIIYIEKAIALLKECHMDKIIETLDNLIKSMLTILGIDMQLYDVLEKLINMKENYLA